MRSMLLWFFDVGLPVAYGGGGGGMRPTLRVVSPRRATLGGRSIVFFFGVVALEEVSCRYTHKNKSTDSRVVPNLYRRTFTSKSD